MSLRSSEAFGGLVVLVVLLSFPGAGYQRDKAAASQVILRKLSVTFKEKLKEFESKLLIRNLLWKQRWTNGDLYIMKNQISACSVKFPLVLNKR